MITRNIKLTIQYDGTAYHGWQLQPGMPTIEQAVTDAIEKLTGQQVKLHGSSRTDAGVHALGQAASFKIESPVPTENFTRALNQILPDDICITEAVEVDDSFDAISHTKTKRYRYMIDTSPIRNPLQIRYCWHRPGMLDVEAMQSAAEFLKGTHDFKSFASAADQRQSSTRTITDISVTLDNNTISFEVEADGFLYNMVRNIVGTLIEIGRSRWTPDYIKQILDARDRNSAGPIAPPGGLCLMRIDYLNKTMDDKQYLNGLKKDACKSIDFFSNKKKPEREKSVCRAFLRTLGITFQTDDIKASTKDPPDIEYKDARFEITERLDDNRERDKEYKDRKKQYEITKSPKELLETYSPSKPITLSKLLIKVDKSISKKEAKQNYTSITNTLDILVYINLQNRHLEIDPTESIIPNVKYKCWRSVSLLFPPFGIVLFTDDSAPDFLINATGKVWKEWSNIDTLFE